MRFLRGVYTYDIPESITKGIPGSDLEPISDKEGSYSKFTNRADINFLIVRQGIVNEIIRYFPNVEWIQLLNAGFERVDLDLLSSRGITLTNAKSVYSVTIAEDVMAKILVLARNYMIHFRDQTDSRWPDDVQLANRNIDLMGRTIGIIGAGGIGREIAKRAKAFGMHTIAYDPYAKAQDEIEEIYHDTEGLHKLLAAGDFIITSLPVTEETKNIISAHTLSLMRPDSFFINVSRGEIVDEDALIEALNNSRIRGAAIDVAKSEPLPPDSPLWKAKNILITPHRAAYGDQMQKRMCGLIERNIRHYLDGEYLENLVLCPQLIDR